MKVCRFALVIVFDGLASWNFVNNFAKNFLIFGVDNSSSYHTDNRKNDFSLLGESLTDHFNGRIGVEEKNLSINLKKEKEKISLEFALQSW